VSGFVFGRGSNVLEYWLVNAEGFVVRSRGSRVGVVRGVVIDPARGRASALVLRSPLLHRRRVVLARAFEAVDPEGRLLELEPEEKRGPSRLERLRRWSDALDRRADGAGAWLRPRLRAWAAASADRLGRALREGYARGAEAARASRRGP
jgi:hypothetical protein